MTESSVRSAISFEFKAEGTDLDALQKRIMADIEEKLSKKEDSLWRRGQVEIKKLQSEQKEVTAAIASLQEQQAALLAENQKMRGALVQVTSKFEQVVVQMREVLRAMPQQTSPQQLQQGQVRPAGRIQMRLSPSPSEASTAASGEVLPKDTEPTPGSSSTADPNLVGSTWSVDRTSMMMQHTPLTMWHGNRGNLGAETFAEAACPPMASRVPETEVRDLQALFTPPRAAPSPLEDLRVDSLLGLAPPASWHSATSSSPAVPLSLASALPSTGPAPATPLKRLQLAECLGEQQVVPSSSKIDALMATPPLPSRRSEEPTSVSGASLPNLISVEIVKEPGFNTLGVEVNQVDTCLSVEEIDAHGLIGRFNAKQETDSKGHKVLVGDHIVEVNGIRNDPNRMLHECKFAQRLLLTLRRLQAAESSAALKSETGSPSTTKLRPEAQEFVPSTQAVPPGLAHSIVLNSLESDSCVSAELPAVTPTTSLDGQEVKRALFH